MSYLTDDELTMIRLKIIEVINSNVYEIGGENCTGPFVLKGVEETADELCAFLKEFVE